MGLSWVHVLAIIVIVLLLFGADKLPELARSVAKAIKEFKKAMKEVDEEDHEPAKKAGSPAKKKKK